MGYKALRVRGGSNQKLHLRVAAQKAIGKAPLSQANSCNSHHNPQNQRIPIWCESYDCMYVSIYLFIYFTATVTLSQSFGKNVNSIQDRKKLVAQTSIDPMPHIYAVLYGISAKHPINNIFMHCKN